MNPQVTVLTAVYNGLPYLKEAIESTLSQSYSNFEYLIIDDGSTDGSVECIESYKDPRIRFVKNAKNLGTANTINRALSLIRTPYVVRLDQDDVSLPRRIEEQIDFLVRHPEIAIVCSWEHTIDENGRRVRDCRRTIRNYGEFLGPILLGICPIWHPSIAFRKSAMDEVGGFDAEYTRAEDFEVTVKLALKRLNATVIPRFHLLQREHRAQQSGRYNEKQASVNRRIHEETIGHFVGNGSAESLACFMRLEDEPDGSGISGASLLKLKAAFDELLSNVTARQQLSKDERSALEKVIRKRIGYGVDYAGILARLPSFLFYPCFYALSPLQWRSLKRMLSNLYMRARETRYIFK